MNTRKKGSGFEDVACRYLEENGYIILQRNFRTKHAEIDIIARDGRYLVFIEVKARGSGRRGFGAEAVGIAKQERISSASRIYLARYHYPSNTPVRYDVISIDAGVIRLIRNAFPFRTMQWL